MQETVELLLESLPRILIPGIIYTIPLTIIAFSLAIAIGTITALIQYANFKVLKELARFYIWVIRGTPLLVQLMIAFYGPSTFGVQVNAFVAAIFVFAVNEGAYCAETIRGSLESVPRGQLEAGYCAGLNFLQIMWHIVLPQTFRTAFPALSNSVISMVKDTSLASNITVTEMFMSARQIAGRTYQFLPLYIEVAVIYLIFSTVLTTLQKAGERKLNTLGGIR